MKINEVDWVAVGFFITDGENWEGESSELVAQCDFLCQVDFNFDLGFLYSYVQVCFYNDN